MISCSGACKDLDAVEVCACSATTCEAIFITDGKTCDIHCESMGLECEMGWDETSKSCDSKVSNDQNRIGNGCGMPYKSQICRCSVGNSKNTLPTDLFHDNNLINDVGVHLSNLSYQLQSTPLLAAGRIRLKIERFQHLKT